MELGYGAEYDSYRDEVRTFLAAHWPWPGGEEISDGDRARLFRQAAIERGYFARSVPKQYGGSAEPPNLVKAEIIREEIKRANAPSEVRNLGTNLLVPTLLEWGTEAQRERFIPRTISGDYLWAQGFSEPAAGSDLASVQTRGELRGDKWIINGQKVWSTLAHQCQYMFALVRTEPEAAKRSGISYLLIDLRQPGVQIRPLRQMTRRSEFCEVFFEDAHTPANWIVGDRGNGWRVAKSTLTHERSSLSGLAWTDSMFRGLVKLAQQRTRDGRPAIEDMKVREELAGIYAQSLALTYSTYRSVSMSAAGQDAGSFPLMAKISSTNLAARMALLARDLIGDDLLSMDGPNAKWVERFMISLSMAIAGGTSNIQRNIIAERGLGLPRAAQQDT